MKTEQSNRDARKNTRRRIRAADELYGLLADGWETHGDPEMDRRARNALLEWLWSLSLTESEATALRDENENENENGES